jgi:UDP-glucose 4-epimerase
VSAPRALVTGGAGFIGGHLVESLVADGWRTRVLDDFSTGREVNLAAVGGDAELVRGDVRDPDTVARAIAGVEVVFHQAAVPSVSGSVSEPVHTHCVNVLGTLHVLEAARKAGVRRLVHASSASVYGCSPDLPKCEDMPTDPGSPYALQKRTAEDYCRVFQDLHGLETIALRYFNVYGPRQDAASEYAAAIPRFVAAGLRGARPLVEGDGKQTRDFVYVGDVVRANRLAAEAPTRAFEICNVASGRPVSVLDLLAEIARETGAEMQPTFGPPRPGDVRHCRASLARAREVLGYAPTVSLEEGLRRTIAYFEREVGTP